MACLDAIADDDFTIIARSFSGESDIGMDEPYLELEINILIFSIVPLDVELVKEESDNMLRELGIELEL